MANNRLWIVCDAAKTCTLLAKWQAGGGWGATLSAMDALYDSDFDTCTDTGNGTDSALRLVKETDAELIGYSDGVVSLRSPTGATEIYTVLP